MKIHRMVIAFVLSLAACSTAPGSGLDAGGVSVAQFNKDGAFEGSSYELQDLGWEITQPTAPAWVGLTDADPAADKTPGAGLKIMKLDFWDTVQHSTRGFTMQKRLSISEAGTYTLRFKYKGKGFSGAIKVSFDGDEKTIPTADWSGSAGWEWNSADGNGGYENFAASGASTADYTLEAKTYTLKFSITGNYAAGEWGYIDGLEIVKK